MPNRSGSGLAGGAVEEGVDSSEQSGLLAARQVLDELPTTTTPSAT